MGPDYLVVLMSGIDRCLEGNDLVTEDRSVYISQSGKGNRSE